MTRATIAKVLIAIAILVSVYMAFCDEDAVRVKTHLLSVIIFMPFLTYFALPERRRE